MTGSSAPPARDVRVSNAARVMWPATGFTKGAMIDYYRAVAPVLLPHLRRRPLTLGRFPEGVDRPGWLQAQCRGRPDWLAVHEISGKRGQALRYCLVEDEASLVWIANLGTVELHPFLWRLPVVSQPAWAERGGLVVREAPPREPTALVFDLDPGPAASLATCAVVALAIRELLERVELEAVPKTSGSLGLHLYVPLARGQTFAATKAFARSVARLLARRRPDLVVEHSTRASRGSRVFLDWVQNDASRSTVAPYSLRAMPVPLVSVPVRWSEIEATARDGLAERLVFGPAEAIARLDQFGDLAAPAAGYGAAILPDPSVLSAAVEDRASGRRA